MYIAIGSKIGANKLHNINNLSEGLTYLTPAREKDKSRIKMKKAMQGTDLKELELGYLYYSLYSYRRKIEADIKKIIRADSVPQVRWEQRPDKGQAETLFTLTQKLRNISLIISKLISLNKVYK